MNARRPLLLSAGLAFTLLAACAPHDDASSDLATRASAAIPSADGVKLTTPGVAGAATKDARPAFALQGGTPGGYAEYYRITRDLFDGVNLGTGWVLGTVLVIVHLPPTAVKGNVATWGPGSEALDPADWRMVVTETAHEEFDYELQGRRKGDAGDFRAVLKGNGYGKPHAKHGQGTFTLYYDVANDLDPTRLGAGKDSGTLSITHDVLTPNRSISVTSRPSTSERKWDITTSRLADDSGTVHVEAVDDVDPSKSTQLESLIFDSHFAPSGAGHAKVTLSGGDIPGGITVHADECWTAAPGFTRSYYTDDASLEPQVGAESDCVF